VDFLRKRTLLPVVAFTFSKRRCETNAAALANIDLCSGSEKSDVQVFMDQSLKRLKGAAPVVPVLVCRCL
jgi:antiviral helicase SKI2